MAERAYLVFPLISAALYALGAMLLKAAQHRGARARRVAVWTNLALAIAFLVFYPWGEFPKLASPWWPCLVTGAAFAVANLFTILALSYGEASVATPALGMKVVLVAFGAWAFADSELSAGTWAAAFVTLAGLICLVGPVHRVSARKALAALGFSLVAAIGYAAFDVMIQVWTPELTFGLLAPAAMIFTAVLSLPLAMTRRGISLGIPRGARGLLIGGVGLFVVQGMLLIWAIGRFQDAAGANVVYAGRGVLSVLLVSVTARWFGRVERFESRGVFVRRLVGAITMAAAVGLLFV
jgi:drug/metabolite transporter (DMT)-like permease